ncbi:F0F1 ATP synthase subunit A [Candidatus Anaplasma sp. TIGMIC]|uniref:F0F1 ATP synthase subunit A n=1 Tax=Candidatus Anaplasma sp. TIGMIC TaxID=3020713 RepID=UPI00232AFC9E|nr:F0F1 ATP synthase subunit A [Candidatus Anaplasma sp. TIGMIC]MDB1135305.1 F0F1 ATP synthase subunit A [Candidatus Anaplasma sp. TIGMIC]
MSPLEQFKVVRLLEVQMPFGLDVSFTNCALFMILASLGSAVLLLFSLRHRVAVSYGSGPRAAVEMIYNFVAGAIESNAGEVGLRYVPLVLTTFLFVLACNLIGIVPFGFTATSHVSVTLALSIVVCASVTVVGFSHQGLHFLRIFLPEGTPLWLAPMMVFIKLFAYLARPVSLAIRLAANMIAGHTIIAVIAEFVLKMHPVLFPLPFAFIMVLIAFEIFVAVLQAYIFTVLTTVYLSDAVSKH